MIKCNNFITGDNSTVPLDYVRNLNQPQNMAAGSTPADVESLHKPSWSEQMHMQTFSDNKINNGNILEKKLYSCFVKFYIILFN